MNKRVAGIRFLRHIGGEGMALELEHTCILAEYWLVRVIRGGANDFIDYIDYDADVKFYGLFIDREKVHPEMCAYNRLRGYKYPRYYVGKVRIENDRIIEIGEVKLVTCTNETSHPE